MTCVKLTRQGDLVPKLEAATLLPYGSRTLDRERDRGHLVEVKIGRQVFFERQEIERAILRWAEERLLEVANRIEAIRPKVEAILADREAFRVMLTEQKEGSKS